jgi:hypothetical protein
MSTTPLKNRSRIRKRLKLMISMRMVNQKENSHHPLISPAPEKRALTKEHEMLVISIKDGCKIQK